MGESNSSYRKGLWKEVSDIVVVAIVNMRPSPVIHADENDRLAKFDGPRDNATAIVSAEPNFKTGVVGAKEKKTDAEDPPIS